MKIALCLAGQIRTLDAKIVIQSLKTFFLQNYDCDVYISTWDNRGVSYCHGNVSEAERIKSNNLITADVVRDIIPGSLVEVENLNQWIENLTPEYRWYYENCHVHHKGFLPQLYKKHRAYEMIRDRSEVNYDYIIITRPDIFYWENLNIEKYLKEKNTIFNFNLEGSMCYHPSRIYDIFYMGDRESVEGISETYNNIKYLLDDPFGSGLDTFDACKMLYLFARKYKNLNVQTVSSIPGAIFRGDTETEMHYYSKLTGFDVDTLKKQINI